MHAFLLALGLIGEYPDAVLAALLAATAAIILTVKA